MGVNSKMTSPLIFEIDFCKFIILCIHEGVGEIKFPMVYGLCGNHVDIHRALSFNHRIVLSLVEIWNIIWYID